MRLAFMGSPDFAATILAALLDSGHDVAAVYCRKPRPAGRSRHERRCAVHELALRRGLAVRTPESWKAVETVRDLASLGAEVAVVAAYGLLLPQAALDAPRLGCVNVHASLLPRWRGAAPIERAILAGDAATGISLMRMTAGLDSGPVLARRPLAIGPGEDAGSLRHRLAALGAEMTVAMLPDLAAGKLPTVPQEESLATYAAKISPAEARLAWELPAADLLRRVRAFAPSPGAWCESPAGERLKILKARLAPARPEAAPGRVLDAHFTIACGVGALTLEIVQREGRRPLPAAEVQRGLRLAADAILR